MAKRTRRRTFRRPNPQRRAEDAAERQRSIEAAARSLLARRSPDDLQRELEACEQALAETDQLAQLDPNPVNLNRYRTVFADHQVLQLALRLAQSDR